MTDIEINEKIEEISVQDEMENSFLEYAFSVIYARALPDARDGLKPVQRRIIFQMDQMGLDYNKPFVKSARVVGDVMGKLHPHGDSAIYDAMVRLAQDFNQRHILIEGHGNFGSPDDRPAAARYTEARPSYAAKMMTTDIKEDTVDFAPNYDNKLKEPLVLPAAIPNLLVNGGMGIAVGMATNMAPHNLGEVVRAAAYLLKHRDCSIKDLMKFIPGPDLPGGAMIIGNDGIKDAYNTGRGVFKMRATSKVEKIGSHNAIIITELPFGVGFEKVTERIKTAVNNKKIQGISTYKDLTDRKNGLRYVIKIKNGFNEDAILTKLYYLTPLEENFSINNVALVEGEPKTLGLKEILEVWCDHRLEVILRRSKYRKLSANERLHLLKGLLIAILDIDKVIHIIRNSDDSNIAKTELINQFKLDDIQAEYILELKLRRLTKFSKIELENQIKELEDLILYLDNIINNEDVLIDTAIIEMQEASSKIRNDRRTKIITDAGEIKAIEEQAKEVNKVSKLTSQTTENLEKAFSIKEEKSMVVFTADKMIVNLIPQSGSAAPSTKRFAHDAITNLIPTTTISQIGVVTNLGKLTKIDVSSIPNQKLDESFKSFEQAIEVDKIMPTLEQFEHIIGIVSLDEKSDPIAIGTLKGQVKRVNMKTLQKGSTFNIISLEENDEIIGISQASDNDNVVFITGDAQLLHYKASKVRPQGINGGGMAGIKLQEGVEVISFSVIQDIENATVVTSAGTSDALVGTDPGAGKTTSLSEFPEKGRATGGVRCQRFLKGQDQLIFAGVSRNPAGALNFRGKPCELPLEGKRDASGTTLSDSLGSLGFLIS